MGFRTFIADVTRDPDEAIEKFVEGAKELDLTVLVNNVGGTKGFLETDFKRLSDHSPTEIANVMQANMRFSTVLTAALLPTLAQHQPSLIINTGSTSAVGMPYLSVLLSMPHFPFSSCLGGRRPLLPLEISLLTPRSP